MRIVVLIWNYLHREREPKPCFLEESRRAMEIRSDRRDQHKGEPEWWMRSWTLTVSIKDRRRCPLALCETFINWFSLEAAHQYSVQKLAHKPSHCSQSEVPLFFIFSLLLPAISPSVYLSLSLHFIPRLILHPPPLYLSASAVTPICRISWPQ